MSTSGRKGYHHGNLRSALVTAARELVADAGPAGVSLRAVAERAGVSPAAPYRHFADKEALLAAVTEEGFTELADAVAAAADGTGLAALHSVGYAYIEFAVEHQALYRLMFGAQIPDRGRHAGLAAAEDRLRAEMDARLAAARAGGAIADLAAEDVLLTMASVMHGLALLIGDGRVPAEDAKSCAERVMNVVDTGLRPRQEAGSHPGSEASTASR